MFLPKMNIIGYWSILKQNSTRITISSLRYWVLQGARLSEFQQFTWEDIATVEVVLKGKGTSIDVSFSRSNCRGGEGLIKETGKSGLLAVGRFGPLTQRGFLSTQKAWGKHVRVSIQKNARLTPSGTSLLKCL